MRARLFLFVVFWLGCFMVVRAARAEESKIAADAVFQYGFSYPQQHLSHLLKTGQSYRLNLFGGAKLQSKWIGAVGLGLDFTYSNYPTKNQGNGSYYRRYQWDLFAIPLSFWLFVFKAGISWNVTHTKLLAHDIHETSIRPGFVADLGLRIPLAKHVLLRGDVRAEKVIKDTEIKRDGSKQNISGVFLAWLAGIELYF